MSMPARIVALTVLAIGFSQGAPAADEKLVLFSNPLNRDSTVVPKLTAIRFVTVDDFVPFSSFDQGNTLRGINVDLARTICTELKIVAGCTLQVAAFKEIENLLTTGQADIALAGLVPTVQNRANLNFSVPYFRYSSKFLIQKGKALQDNDLIGVIKNSAHQDMAKLLFLEYRQSVFDDELQALNALKAGNVSAVFGDGLSLAALQANNVCCELSPDNYFLPLIRPDMLRATTARSRNDVLTALNFALRQLAANGGLEEIYLRHLPVNPLQ